MKKDIAVFGEQNCISLQSRIYIYLGTIEDFLNMSEKSWLEMRQSILTNFGAIWFRGTARQTSKLCFTDKIDKMRKNKKNGINP